MTRDVESGTDPRVNAAIDAALRNIGSAAPASDLQGRIVTRLAAERLRSEAASPRSSLSARLGELMRVSAPALGGLSACLAAALIVAGSVSHSHRLHISPVVAPPPVILPVQGIGAAGAVHPAAPASAPVPAGQAGRARTARKSQGRARIAPHAHKAPGIAVPSPSGTQN